MDGGAYAPIVSRILKSGRWVGSDGGKVAQEWLGLEGRICGEKFPASNRVLASVGKGKSKSSRDTPQNHRTHPYMPNIET